MKLYGFEIRLSGWRWLGAVVLIGALFAARNSRSHSLTNMQLAEVRALLVAEYTRAVLPPVQGPAQSREQLVAVEKELLARQNVELASVSVRGLLWPKYVRVEPTAHGKLPPDGKTAQYFEINPHGSLTRKPSEFAYYLNLF